MLLAKKNKLNKNHLSDDIAVQILSRSSVKSLIRFTCVSKRWRSIISDPQFAKSQFKVASEQQTLSPRLIISNNSQLQSLDLKSPSSGGEGDCLIRNLSFPFKQPDRAVRILGSCNGLVCVALDLHEGFYIWNPSAGFLQKLPDPGFKSEKIRRLHSYGLGYVSASDDYKVVVAAALTDQIEASPFEVFSFRANSWKRIEVPFLNQFTSSKLNGALSNEALHWIYFSDPPIVRQAILTFDLAKEEFRDVQLPIVEDDEVFFRQAGVLLEGCLCASSHRAPDLHILNVWVMREYGVRESWTMLYKFKIADQPGWMLHTEPIFFTESGILVMQEFGNMEKEFRWFDQEGDKFNEYVVCGGRYRVDGVQFANYVMEYAESLLPCLCNITS